MDIKENFEDYDLSYDGMKEKALREIERLIAAESKLNKQDALDSALNAAFTIYHLLDWYKQKNNITIKTHQLCKRANNVALQLLHSVVTNMKHVTIGDPISKDDYKQKIDDQVQFLATGSGHIICTEDGSALVLSQSKITVYFGDKIAKNILKDALELFKKENILVSP